ncbi:chitin synthase chs-2-like [Paramacrobiotus metropolitanus]|uniref:chitin synthase chs-2-like n=1 Tax=Paramacrobiotus metropolitanus TaxID=2943436 RepID=UPI0024456080|nr:chitin synthase chs-2-like [Paramacrobiotus metropolitanus]
MSSRREGHIRELFRRRSQRDWNRIRHNLVRRSRKQRSGEARGGGGGGEPAGHEDNAPGTVNDAYVSDVQTQGNHPKVTAFGHPEDDLHSHYESASVLRGSANNVPASLSGDRLEETSAAGIPGRITDSAADMRAGWDVFRTVPHAIENTQRQGACIEICLQIVKSVVHVITFLLVLIAAVISKSTVLLMVSQLDAGKRVQSCKRTGTITLPVTEAVYWRWILLFAFWAPQFFTFCSCLRHFFFKRNRRPPFGLFCITLLTETLHTVGLGTLFFQVLPGLDAVKGAMLTNCICVVPAILQFFARSRGESRRLLKFILDLLALTAQISGIVLWPLALSDVKDFWSWPIAFVLTSIPWWENFLCRTDSSFEFVRNIAKRKEILRKSRYVTYLVISLWKALVMLGTMTAWAHYSIGVPALFNFTATPFRHQPITLPVTFNTSGTTTPAPSTHPSIIQQYISLWVLLVQVIASYICYQTAKFACKIGMQRFSFAFPLSLTVPAVASLLITICGMRAGNGCFLTNAIPESLYWTCFHGDVIQDLFFRDQTWVWILWLFSQTWITLHIWIPKAERLAKTDRLFIIPMYEGLLVDQSLSLNRRMDEDPDVQVDELVKRIEEKPVIGDEMYETPGVDKLRPGIDDLGKGCDSVTKIFACATMWHETTGEMMQVLKSIMRMDEDQSARRNALQFINGLDPDYYEFEAHIIFDDAFEAIPNDALNSGETRVMNRFVRQLLEVIDKAASAVHQCNVYLRPPRKIPTPYGGRLVWTMPGKNTLVVHLKDTAKIRQRKRWSQVMCWYYLLGHRLMDQEMDVARKDIIAENTYILTLDGDIDFMPHAVQLLVDLMKKNPKVGAACGRIHPTGGGPMVWYQKFEYAIGHWLQKATEHMIGCVLCSPGCFSLFRAKALMDDNVMRKYTTRSERAMDYVQFDQGEDRWLCTLLLQRGYRVEYCAAADAYTHAPEGFNEFFNQRRRWIPSTLANIMDLLLDYRHTIKANDNISILYILYQTAMMIGTVLSAGTIFLMICGAMVAAFKIDNWTSFMANATPIVLFIACCFIGNVKIQLLFAKVLSGAYAMLMMAVAVGTAIQIKDDGIASPGTIFMIALVGTFFLAACLHPQEFLCIVHGLEYFLAIPAMYLLLMIYSLTNLNIVTWGTREVLNGESDAVTNDKPQKTNLIFNWWRKKQNPGQVPEQEDGNVVFGCGNLCKFMFCMHQKPESEKTQVLCQGIEELKMKMEQIDRRLRVEMEPHFIPDYRNLNTMERNLRMNFPRNQPPVPMNNGNPLHPSWLDERSLRLADCDYLTANETLFWKDLIIRYLHPLDYDGEQRVRVSRELKALRNKVALGFFMINSLFVLIVFLLQLRKDELHIVWPIGFRQNQTWVNCTSVFGMAKGMADPAMYGLLASLTKNLSALPVPVETTLCPKTELVYLKLEPIGVVFVFFFLLILVIQFIAMLFHRFGTISHILASTELFCCRPNIKDISDDEFIEKNAVEIARALQALRGIDEDELMSMESGELTGSSEEGDPSVRNRNRHMIQHLENHRKTRAKTRTLDVAFRKRFQALQQSKNEDVSDSNSQGSGEPGEERRRPARVKSFSSPFTPVLGLKKKFSSRNKKKGMRTLGAKDGPQPANTQQPTVIMVDGSSVSSSGQQRNVRSTPSGRPALQGLFNEPSGVNNAGFDDEENEAGSR